MSVEPTRSQYRRVADLIKVEIDNGTYPRGSTLPKQEELAETLRVNINTVNRALKILESEGLVRLVRGKATTVTAIAPIQRNAVARYNKEIRERSGGRGAFDSEIREQGMEPRSEQVVSRVAPPAHVAGLLAVPEDGSVVVRRARHMYADRTPVQLADSYIPLDIAEGTPLEQQDSGPGGIVSRFAELGFAQVRITERINVRTPSQEEIERLELTEDQRVYEILHTGWTAEGRAVEVCVHIMPTHLWTLDYEWPVS
jgi:GntR family transcriptional regulator